jgi:glycosyltransferase involved in cell wall biosynthesis
MPPARNGIADYAYQLVAVFADKYQSTVFCEDAFAEVPRGVRLADWMQAFRFVGSDTCCIHQIGNNWDHSFVVKSVHAFPGIVVLHDMKLLYLHESLDPDDDAALGLLARSNPYMARIRATDIALAKHKLRADYVLFDMLSDVAEAARAIVVHSHFARSVIARHLGPEVGRRTHVIPHFAYAPPAETRETARARLGLEPGWFVIVTCGFATPVKRYDWLVEALDRLAGSRRNIVWVQAGPVRPDEFDLDALIARYPRVRSIVRLAGYVSAEDLEGYITAADVVINLRFPSVGESSGILARALSAGACCVVSDTAAYREFPDDVVLKVPVTSAPRRLAAVLAGLIDAPEVRSRYSENARRFARDELSLERYGARMEAVISACMEEVGRPAAAGHPGLPAGEARPVPGPDGGIGSRRIITLGPLGDDLVAFDTLAGLVPPALQTEHAELVYDEGPDGEAQGEGKVFLNVAGRVLS